MSFSNINPINTKYYYTKKYQKRKKVRIPDRPISVKATQMTNIDFNNKVKGNMISIAYFNSKINNNKENKDINYKINTESQANYYSLLLDNNQNDNKNKNEIMKKTCNNNSYYYSKTSQNSLIINIINTKSKNARNINSLNEVLQKYSNYSYKPKLGKKLKDDYLLDHKRNNSLNNNIKEKSIQKGQNKILSTEKLFNNSSNTSNIKRTKKNSVIKIEHNNNIKNLSTNTNNSYINTNILGKEGNNKKTYAERIKMKIKKRNEKNMKLIILQRNNRSYNNLKVSKSSKLKEINLNIKYNKTSYFNNSTTEIMKNHSQINILNIADSRIKNKYIITPKNITKDCDFIIKEKKKIVKKYHQYYKKRGIIKQNPIFKLNTNMNNNSENNSKEKMNNNKLIQKHNTSINLINKKNVNKKNIKNSINIIDIFRIKKPNSKIIKRKKSSLCINNIYINTYNKIDKPKKETKIPLNPKHSNLKGIQNNKIQNKLFDENNLINTYTEDNFDDLYSIIKKLKFTSNYLNLENIFSINNQEYKNYAKKFNIVYNNFYAKYITKKKQKNRTLKKSYSKLFTESTKMKTNSHSKKKSNINIDINCQISEFKLD